MKKEETNDETKLPINISINCTADLTELINRLYSDVTAPFRYLGNALGFTIEYLTCETKTKMFKKSITEKKKMEDFAFNLYNKHNNIPKENVVMPRMSILGPVGDVLKYNLDETEIKVMFVNLLSKEIDDRTQNKVHPAFIEVIKQINKEDALFIKALKDTNLIEFPVCDVIVQVSFAKGYRPIARFIYNPKNKKDDSPFFESSDVVLNNLQRLGIIEFKQLEMSSYKIEVDRTFEQIHDIILKQNPKPGQEYSYKPCMLKITDFGKQFIDICCS